MPKKNILILVGTRPNFIKITQFERVFASRRDQFEYKLCHTGQHYDRSMSEVFFEQLKLREPDYYLDVGKGSPTTQLALIMQRLEGVMLQWKPDLLIVVGDVNSTLAGALTANKMGIPLAHLESGLRSSDRGMPEEINRILTDEIAKYHYVTEQSGWDNLIAEGKAEENIFFVGNTMIDTLVGFDAEIQESSILENLELTSGQFVLTTIHRPATVDNQAGLEKLIEIITRVAKRSAVVFPIHPRTRHNLEKFGLDKQFHDIQGLIPTEPMGYLDFQKLIAHAKYVLTDSGGIQEETTFRQIPCLTLRPNTERPVTLTEGSNELITFDLDHIMNRVEAIESGTFKKGTIPKLWDGKATERVVDAILKFTD